MNDNRLKTRSPLGLASLAERPMKALTEKYVSSFAICSHCAARDGNNQNLPTPTKTTMISHVMSGIVGCMVPIVALGILYITAGMTALDVFFFTQDR